MSRKKQNERYKILYTPRKIAWGAEPGLFVFLYTVAQVIGPPINDYWPMAGFDNLKEAKAYRRAKIHADRARN